LFVKLRVLLECIYRAGSKEKLSIADKH